MGYPVSKYIDTELIYMSFILNEPFLQHYDFYGSVFFFQYSNTYFKHHIFMHTKQSFNAYNNTQR